MGITIKKWKKKNLLEQIYIFIRAHISTMYRKGLTKTSFLFKFFNLIYILWRYLWFKIHAIRVDPIVMALIFNQNYRQQKRDHIEMFKHKLPLFSPPLFMVEIWALMQKYIWSKPKISLSCLFPIVIPIIFNNLT